MTENRTAADPLTPAEARHLAREVQHIGTITVDPRGGLGGRPLYTLAFQDPTTGHFIEVRSWAPCMTFDLAGKLIGVLVWDHRSSRESAGDRRGFDEAWAELSDLLAAEIECGEPATAIVVDGRRLDPRGLYAPGAFVGAIAQIEGRA